MKELLRGRLIESGWRDQLKTKCKQIIQNKGLQKITVQQLVQQINGNKTKNNEKTRINLIKCIRNKTI